MPLNPEVLQAFALLGIDPDADIQTATKAYKRQALLHHPDRNHGDPQATQRFQEIGSAWNICQRHFDNPAWSSQAQASYTSTNTYSFSADDDIPLDEDELREFYMFMFAETLFGRYTRSKGQRYRYERSGRAGGGVYSFSGGFAQSQERQARNTERQRKENEEYEKRKRELELEIEQEERERSSLAKKMKADEDRRANALENAFRAAGSGDSSSVKSAILEYDLDVNTSRKRSKGPKKQDTDPPSDSLLHVVAGHCDEQLFMFLIERGANPLALNKAQLNPFHVAIRAGNISIVQYIMEHRGRSFDVYHPSKASPSGRTPLQLAIESGIPFVVELLVKYATTHDVERCWEVEGFSEEIKEILLKKKGFVPPDTVSHPLQPTPSKKSQRQKELDQEKQARLAEELERAAINRKRREERTRKRAEKDREEAAIKLAQEQARLKAEAEMKERKRLEDNRRLQEQARAKLLEETRINLEAEQRAVASRTKVKREEKKRQDRSQKEEPVRTPEGPKHASEESHTCLSSLTVASLDPTVAIEKVVSSPNAVSADERKASRYLKMKEKRKEKLAKKRQQKEEQAEKLTTPLIGSSSAVSKADVKKAHPLKTVAKDTQDVEEANRRKNEDILRRRAEQSTRDKERHHRLVEERAKVAQANRNAEPATDLCAPLTPVSNDIHHKQERMQMKNNIPSQPPLLVPQASICSFGGEFVMPIEDIQTCIVPEDLFRDERESGFVSSRGRGR